MFLSSLLLLKSYCFFLNLYPWVCNIPFTSFKWFHSSVFKVLVFWLKTFFCGRKNCGRLSFQVAAHTSYVGLPCASPLMRMRIFSLLPSLSLLPFLPLSSPPPFSFRCSHICLAVAFGLAGAWAALRRHSVNKFSDLPVTSLGSPMVIISCLSTWLS